MNIARLLKPNEKSYLFKAVTGGSAVWRAPKTQRPESTLIHRGSPAVAASPNINVREMKSLTQDRLWVDMTTNALIVIVIASASYFFISAKSVRAIIEPALTSQSESSQSR